MDGHQLIGAMEVIRCPQCDWQSPVFRTPLAPERAREIDSLVVAHRESHRSEDEPRS